jgi:hypothetical protein
MKMGDTFKIEFVYAKLPKHAIKIADGYSKVKCIPVSVQSEFSIRWDA